MKTQRGFAELVTLAIYAGIALAIAGVLYGAYYSVQHWCNTVCKDARLERDGLQAEKKAAQERATAMTMLWDRERTAREADARQREGDRNARFVVVEKVAATLPAADAHVRIPDSAVRVLDGAVAAGNAGIARPATEPATETRAPPADPAGAVDVAGLTGWVVTAARQYAACTDQVAGWQAFYGNILAAQFQNEVH